ncbi:MAG TPA: alpha/beta fold hydrolase [Candidatus Binatia bacterium]
MLEEKVSFSINGAKTIVGILHHPVGVSPHGAIILCHGMDSTKNSEKLVSLGRSLARRGFLTLRFDFAYVGESSEKFEDITYSGEVEDLRAAFSFMRDRYSGGIGILGSSMGGAVALLFAAEEPGVAALVTIAAPVHPEAFPRRVLSRDALQKWRERGFTFYNGQRLKLALLEDLEMINVVESASKIGCPVLIIHGDNDEIVPVEEALELNACISGKKKLLILRGTDHRLSDPLTMQEAFTEAVDWLTAHVGRRAK